MYYVHDGNFVGFQDLIDNTNIRQGLIKAFKDFYLPYLDVIQPGVPVTKTLELVFETRDVLSGADPQFSISAFDIMLTRNGDGTLSPSVTINGHGVTLGPIASEDAFVPLLLSKISELNPHLALRNIPGIGFADRWFSLGATLGAVLTETAVELTNFRPSYAELYVDGDATGHGLRFPDGYSGASAGEILSYFIRQAIDPHTGLSPIHGEATLKLKSWPGLFTDASYDIFSTAAFARAGLLTGASNEQQRFLNPTAAPGANQNATDAWFYYVASDQRASWTLDVYAAGQARRITINDVYEAGSGQRQHTFGQGDISGIETALIMGTDGVLLGESGAVNLILASSRGHRMIGGVQGDILIGNSGVDDLFGGGGADILDGGEGNDFVQGAANDTALHGGSGFDTLVFSDQPGAAWSITSGGVAIAGGAAQITGFEVIAGSLSGFDIFHVSGFVGELHLRGGAGGRDDYYFSGEYSRVFVEDTGISDRLFIDGVLVAGEAVQTENAAQTYSMGGFLITWVGNALEVQKNGSMQVLHVADWRQGDYGLTLTNLPPDDDEGDNGGDTDGDGDVDGDDDHDGDGIPNREDGDWPGHEDDDGAPDPDRPDSRDEGFLEGEGQFNRSGQPLADPLVIDLDGDGLELISRDQGVLFDIDNDGVLERVGWVGPDDGFLAVDANNNGRIDGVSELFGDPGQLGFAELATYNTHNEMFGFGGPVIDSRDAAFEQLLVWRDLNQNGRSEVGELSTLTQAGITAIPLSTAGVGQWLEGNLVFERVLYDRAGSQRFAEVSEVFLNYSETGRPDALGPQAGPAPGAFDLPESRGYGQLASWSRKAASDTAFRTALENLAELSLDNLDQATALAEKLLIAWADAEGVEPGTRGGVFAADKLAVLEAIFGRGWVDSTGSSNPNARSAAILEASWDAIVATFRDRALMQGPLDVVFPDAVYAFAADEVDLNSDLAELLENLGDLTTEERFSILNAIEPILEATEEQLGLFPGQAQQEVARLAAEFSDEEAIYARILHEFSGVRRELLVTSNDPNHTVHFSGGRIVQGTAFTDRVTITGDGASLIHGGAGDDSLGATAAGSYIFGGAGNDQVGGQSQFSNEPGSFITLYGGDGDDIVYSGSTSVGGSAPAATNNRLFGGAGNDQVVIVGYHSNNPIGFGSFQSQAYGGDGNDYLHLGGVRVTGFGESGDDTLLLASGHHVVADGGGGDDTFRFGDWGFGTISHSTAIGGAGNDTFIFDYGPHHRMLTILGGSGSDVARGMAVNSNIDLGDGDDYAEIGFSDSHEGFDSVLLGGTGNDTLTVTSSTDNYYHRTGSATDVRIDGGVGDDLITIRSHTTGGPDALKVWTSAGHDRITFDGGEGVVRVVRLAGDTDTVSFVNNGRATIDLTAFPEIVSLFDLTATFTAGQAVLRLPNGQTLTVIRDGLSALSDLTFRFFDSGLITQTGTAGSDILNGNDGADILLGADGDDRLSGGEGLDRLAGGNGADRLSGGAGDDLLNGEMGDDILLGGAGLDRLDGGTGSDTADYGSAAASVTASLTTGSASSDGDGSSDTLTAIENLTGSSFNDNLTGSGANNVLAGGAGNDTLSGLNGDDILRGGAGMDLLHGGGGIDTVDYSTAAAGMRAQLNTNASTNDGDGGTDTFSGIENLTGSAFNDTLIGDANANVLRGGTGADTLLGLGGNDTLWGGAGALNTLQGGLGNDTYVLEAADSITEQVGEGTDTVDARINTYILANNVENLIFGGTGNFAGTGNALANVITGGAGADVLRGRGGVDVLHGGGGIDTADYTLAAAGVVARIDLQRATNDGDGATDTYTGIENLIGSNFNDTLIGDNNANILMGGIGTDTLLGFGGNDILMGGSGGGNNQMQGGQGDDYYIMDAFDTCFEVAGEGFDTVEARIGSYTLGNNIENLLYTGPGGFTGNGNALNNVITGGNQNDVLRGRGGNDTINGGLGADEVQFTGSKAQYTVTVEGAGYRIVDTIAARDGSTFVTSVEKLRFLTGNTTTTLTYPPVAPGALEPTDKAFGEDFGPEVLPGMDDDGFLLAKDGDAPQVLPGAETGLDTLLDLRDIAVGLLPVSGRMALFLPDGLPGGLIDPLDRGSDPDPWG